MTVVGLHVDAYKRLRAAELHPSPTGLIPVRGRNGAGKSSLIGAMLEALGAEKAELPITEGQHAGEVVLDLGELVVRKKFTRDASGKAKAALSITGADGGKVSSPASVLKELRGRFADPVAFLDQKPEDQVKTVVDVLGVGETLAELEAQALAIFEERRELGREHKRLEAIVSATSVPPDPPEGLRSYADVSADLRRAELVNDEYDALVTRRDSAERDGKGLAARIERAKLELADLEEQRAEREVEWRDAAQALVGRERIDTAELHAELQRASEERAFAVARDQYVTITEERNEAARAHDVANAALGEKRSEISTLLAGVEMPVDGMAYHPDDGLTINGIPFSQASQGERLRAAAGVAMAGSPSIRVLFVKEGSLLDDEARQVLAEAAAEKGFQLWMEIVDSDAEGAGVWIEDGEASE